VGRYALAGDKRRFMAGKRKRPAIGGRGLLGWRGVIRIFEIARRRRPLVGGSGIFPPTQDVPPGAGRRVAGGEAWWVDVVATLSLNRLFFWVWICASRFSPRQYAKGYRKKLPAVAVRSLIMRQ
jgi:hypothetical protein